MEPAPTVSLAPSVGPSAGVLVLVICRLASLTTLNEAGGVLPVPGRRAPSRYGTNYTVECPYCGKRFKRTSYDTKLNAVARQLNERPRKTLGYETPAERYRQIVASTD